MTCLKRASPLLTSEPEMARRWIHPEWRGAETLLSRGNTCIWGSLSAPAPSLTLTAPSCQVCGKSVAAEAIPPWGRSLGSDGGGGECHFPLPAPHLSSGLMACISPLRYAAPPICSEGLRLVALEALGQAICALASGEVWRRLRGTGEGRRVCQVGPQVERLG